MFNKCPICNQDLSSYDQQDFCNCGFNREIKYCSFYDIYCNIIEEQFNTKVCSQIFNNNCSFDKHIWEQNKPE